MATGIELQTTFPCEKDLKKVPKALSKVLVTLFNEDFSIKQVSFVVKYTCGTLSYMLIARM